jgi:hypothetical protein
LFAGSDEGAETWSCLASLIETCKLNGVNPQVYFTDLLTRLVNLTHPLISRVSLSRNKRIEISFMAF